MTLPNPLFQFMPYGAPELLQAQRPTMLRALALASALMLTLFAVALIVTGTLPSPKPIGMPRIPYREMEPPPSIQYRTQSGSSVTSTAVTPNAKIIPVVDEKVPPTEILPVQGDAHPGDGSVGDPQPAGPPSQQQAQIIAEPPLPLRGDWVAVDVMPSAAVKIEPKYPDLPHSLGMEGKVYAYMLVGKDGHVIRVEYDEKRSDPLFVDAVKDAAVRWVFQPALSNGRPVPVWVAETFSFRLH